MSTPVSGMNIDIIILSMVPPKYAYTEKPTIIGVVVYSESSFLRFFWKTTIIVNAFVISTMSWNMPKANPATKVTKKREENKTKLLVFIQRWYFLLYV